MTLFQKIIKYLAIAFAIFIVVNIVSACTIGVFFLTKGFGLVPDDQREVPNGEKITTQIESTETASLNIKLQYSNLKIKKGETVYIESTSTAVKCTQENNNIHIEEEEVKWFSQNTQNTVTLYVPEDFIFTNVNIQTGAGTIEAEKINSDEIELEIGAGKVDIQELNINKNTRIEGAAGKLNIENGQIHNLNLDMGVGKCVVTAQLFGNNKLNAGIGGLDINLINSINNYKIKVEKGIGSININNKEASENIEYGDGINSIKVEGGIGSININTNNQQD